MQFLESLNTMKKQNYLAYVANHADKLKSLLGNYHPASAEVAKNYRGRNQTARITASGAEAACKIARAQIKAEDAEKEHPIARFEKAVVEGDCSEIGSLLQSAWFGVPESTDCWSLGGFREAVHLLEDPVDEEERPDPDPKREELLKAIDEAGVDGDMATSDAIDALKNYDATHE